MKTISTLKSADPNMRQLVAKAFKDYCKATGMKPYINAITFEHGQFFAQATEHDGEHVNFSVVDSGCSACLRTEPRHCPYCNSRYGLDFEQF